MENARFSPRIGHADRDGKKALHFIDHTEVPTAVES
jgi:hypothetical protein